MKVESKETIVMPKRTQIVNLLQEINPGQMAKEIIAGLKKNPKQIPSKFFYDKKGSQLFEEITAIDEYYPTRTEMKILASIWEKLYLDFEELSIVELGSGDASKIRLLLGQIPSYRLSGITYLPVDISIDALKWAVADLSVSFPSLQITGYAADFLSPLKIMRRKGPYLFCFFGSTIGNFNLEEIMWFLRRLGNEMQTGDRLLLGLDMVKEINILEKAYNDVQGITARFNKNILNVVNYWTKGNFQTEEFDHVAWYNAQEQRIEMHLKARRAMEVFLGINGETISLARGEMIHTENSYKFTPADVDMFGRWAGLRKIDSFSDVRQWFTLAYYVKEKV